MKMIPEGNAKVKSNATLNPKSFDPGSEAIGVIRVVSFGKRVASIGDLCKQGDPYKHSN
jgi:hypothetical protein